MEPKAWTAAVSLGFFFTCTSFANDRGTLDVKTTGVALPLIAQPARFQPDNSA